MDDDERLEFVSKLAAAASACDDTAKALEKSLRQQLGYNSSVKVVHRLDSLQFEVTESGFPAIIINEEHLAANTVSVESYKAFVKSLCQTIRKRAAPRETWRTGADGWYEAKLGGSGRRLATPEPYLEIVRKRQEKDAEAQAIESIREAVRQRSEPAPDRGNRAASEGPSTAADRPGTP